MSANDKVRNYNFNGLSLETSLRHVVAAWGLEVNTQIEEPSDRSIVEKFHNIKVDVLWSEIRELVRTCINLWTHLRET